jgi:hypothetical protein
VSYSFTEIDSGFPGGIQLSFRISQQNFIPVVKIKPAEISVHACSHGRTHKKCRVTKQAELQSTYNEEFIVAGST